MMYNIKQLCERPTPVTAYDSCGQINDLYSNRNNFYISTNKIIIIILMIDSLK